MDNLTLKLRGMSCASCASSVEQAIKSVPGVIECSVNFGMEQATIKYDSKQTNLATIQSAVDAAGYEALPLQEMAAVEDDAEQADRKSASQKLQVKLWIAGSISILLVLGGIPAMTG